MKMNLETWKFYAVLYSLVILWCCMIRANGDSDTNVDPSTVAYSDSTSDLLKILSGDRNGKNVKASNSLVSMSMNAETINFNIPFISSVSKTKEIEHETPNNNVRDDYTLTEGIGYHKLHKTKLNWNDARKACMAENAHLTVINSEREERTLRQLMIENTPLQYQAYIGAHDLFEEGDWVTDTGNSLKEEGYYEWASGEPNNYQGEEEDCAVLDKYRGINDVPCSLSYYYICEIPLKL